MRYRLRLFGTFEMILGESRIDGFPTTKTRALLTYLALESAAHKVQTFPRRMLAAFFWPEIGDKYALQNLRTTLYRLHRTIGAMADQTPIVTATREAITFDATQVDVDAAQFQALVHAASSHAHNSLENCAHCMEQLNQALALYGGEVLAGFSLADAPPFEEWLLLQREKWHQQALVVAGKLLTAYESLGDLRRATEMAQRLLALDPYREDAHRTLMRVWALQGMSTQAMAQFQKLQQLIKQELDLEPSQQTQTLAAQIQHGAFDKPSEVEQVDPQQPAAFVTPPRSIAPVETEPSTTLTSSEVPMVGAFFGRHAEQAQLMRWLVHERCQVAAIVGLGGMGKTTLAAQVVRTLIGNSHAVQFHAVIWRSLLNAPKLDEILPPILRQLSHQQLSVVPESIDEQLRLLIRFLQETRVLLVLDNMESILEPTQAGGYRPGYEPYAQLIQQAATREHQSHLLLTSRERPHGYQRLARDSKLIQTLQLTGLDQDAGRELLEQRNLSGQGDDEALLITRYSGNPLALKLVADTVEDIFGGDIGQFLRDESLLFDDIRVVLDQQFARLPPLEQALLLWLAIEREPTSLQSLSENLLRPPGQRLLVEALRALQRCSLIEVEGATFALQNVVTEYLTDRLVEKSVEELMSGELHWFHTHALIKAQAKEYVRQSQERLILQPVADHLLAQQGRERFQAQATRLIEKLRVSHGLEPSYAAGNLLNLLRQMAVDVAGYDFSGVHIRQANLRGWRLPNVNFRRADFSSALFTASFNIPYSVAIQPDGELLVAGTESGAIRIWRLADAQPIQVLEGHAHRVTCVAFSHDGQLLASSSLDDTIRLWDLTDMETTRVLPLPTWGGGVLAFSPDDRLLATGGKDGQIYLWEVTSGRLVHQFDSQVRWIYALAFHPQRYLLACSGRPRFFFIWDLSFLAPASAVDGSSHGPETVAAQFHTVHAPVPALAFGGDGTLLASGGGGYTTEVWDLRNISTVAETPMWAFAGDTSWVRAIALSPDGKTVASGTNEGLLFLSSLQSGQRLDALLGHRHIIHALAFDPAGNTLVSASEDNTIRVWSQGAADRWQLATILQSDTPGTQVVSFSPDGRTLAVGDTKGAIHLWRNDHAAAPLHYDKTLSGHTNSVRAIAFHPEGRLLASISVDKTLCIWDLWPAADDGPCCVNRLTEFPTLHTVGFSHDGHFLYTSSELGDIPLWHIDALGQTQPHRVLQRTHVATVAVAIHPQDDYLIEANYASAPHLWDLRNAEHLAEWTELRDVTALVFSPNGHFAAAASRNGSIGVWSMLPTTQGRLVGISQSCDTPIHRIAFAPDSQVVAGACEDGGIRLWRLENLGTHRRIGTHAAAAHDVAFRPNGDLLASGGNDGLVRLWHPHTGASIDTLRLPGPYEGMNISDVTGISQAQRSALKALGAVEK